MKDRRHWFLAGLVACTLIAVADLVINGAEFAEAFGRGFSVIFGPEVPLR